MLKGVEVKLDLFGCPAGLVYACNTFFKVHTGFNAAKYFITRPEYTAEKLKLVLKQRIDPLVGGVALVEEIHHHNIVFLAVAMAPADSLLDALRVPRQI